MIEIILQGRLKWLCLKKVVVRASLVYCFINDSCQGSLYSGLNELSKSHPNWGRVCALPVSVADVALEVLKAPLNAIENAVLVPINLVGSALSICKFKNSCTLKDSLRCAEWALANAAQTPVAIFMAAPKLAFQFSASVINPKTVESVFYLSFVKLYALSDSEKIQDKLYSGLNELSKSHPNWGCFFAAPVSIVDTALDTLKVPLVVIECTAQAVIHLLGAVLSLGYTFKNSYTTRNSLAYAEMALFSLVRAPVAIFMAAPKLAFQFSAILIDPKTVKSIRYKKPTYSVV